LFHIFEQDKKMNKLDPPFVDDCWAHLQRHVQDARFDQVAGRLQVGKASWNVVARPSLRGISALDFIRDIGTSRTVLFIPSLGKAEKRSLEEAGVGYVEAEGDCFLSAPSTYVLVRLPRKKAAADGGFRSVYSKASARLCLVLLMDRHALNTPYRNLAEVAHMATGSVARVLRELASEGIIAVRGNGERIVMDPEKLLDVFELSYNKYLRPKGFVGHFRTSSSAPGRVGDIPLDGGDVWGGELAAYRLFRRMPPKTYTLFSDKSLGELAKTYRWIKDETGPIAVYRPFWDPRFRSAEDGVAPWPVVYAHLLTLSDPRALELARELRQSGLSDGG
jgi:hypothetical protein